VSGGRASGDANALGNERLSFSEYLFRSAVQVGLGDRLNICVSLQSTNGPLKTGVSP
jgi:hypothetical protein